VHAGDTVTATVRVVDTEQRSGGGLDIGFEVAVGKQDGTPVITATATGFVDAAGHDTVVGR
jgi:hypothetical protein